MKIAILPHSHISNLVSTIQKTRTLVVFIPECYTFVKLMFQYSVRHIACDVMYLYEPVMYSIELAMYQLVMVMKLCQDHVFFSIFFCKNSSKCSVNCSTGSSCLAETSAAQHRFRTLGNVPLCSF